MKQFGAVRFVHFFLVFAQQGYFAVFINPTGSTTFGQGTSLTVDFVRSSSLNRLSEFTDAIAEDWGGKPFDDLIAGWKYVLDKFPQVIHAFLCS
jgi:dipeptidyl aminopeptidase/acylaminoacyl peptidase